VQAQAFQLGTTLRQEYFNPSSPNYIHNVRTNLVNLDEVHVRVKNGGEGRVVFDATIALLQGLFPPNPENAIELANETKVVAPLGGYQYVPGGCRLCYLSKFVWLTSLQLRPSSLQTTARSRAGLTAQ